MDIKQYYVYILTNQSQTVLYTGVTNDLLRRVYEHQNGLTKGFTAKYHVNRLVHYEITEDINTAIAREKQIKAGSRQDKNKLINASNPKWEDLSRQLFDGEKPL